MRHGLANVKKNILTSEESSEPTYDAKRQGKKNHQVDFGVNFLTSCNKFLQQNNNAEVHLETKNVKERCMSMLVEAVSQVTCRLPLTRNNLKVYQNSAL